MSSQISRLWHPCAHQQPADHCRHQTSTARLLDAHSTKRTRIALSRQNTMFQNFLRHVHLLLPGITLGSPSAWKFPLEQREVAAYKSRRMAGLTALLHLIPLDTPLLPLDGCIGGLVAPLILRRLYNL